MSQIRTLKDVLVSLAGREAKSLDPEDALAAVQDYFERHPDRIEEIAPGYRLIKRNITREEHVRRRTEASAKSRANKAKERYDDIIPIIRQAVSENPAITLRGIAAVLDETGPKPQRAKQWSAPAVLYIMNKVGITHEPT